MTAKGHCGKYGLDYEAVFDEKAGEVRISVCSLADFPVLLLTDFKECSLEQRWLHALADIMIKSYMEQTVQKQAFEEIAKEGLHGYVPSDSVRFNK